MSAHFGYCNRKLAPIALSLSLLMNISTDEHCSCMYFFYHSDVINPIPIKKEDRNFLVECKSPNITISKLCFGEKDQTARSVRLSNFILRSTKGLLVALSRLRINCD